MIPIDETNATAPFGEYGILGHSPSYTVEEWRIPLEKTGDAGSWTVAADW